MDDMIFICQIRVVSEKSPACTEADARVEKGIITHHRHAPGTAGPEGAKGIDDRGQLLMPAMFNTHVHSREPCF